MQVTPRKFLPPLCLAAATFTAMTGVSHAISKIVLAVPGGVLNRNYIVYKNQSLEVNQPVKLGKGRVILKGGTLLLNNSIEVPAGTMFPIYGGTFKGNGTIVVRAGGVLQFTGPLKKNLLGIGIQNAGTLAWGGSGKILCGNGTSVKNTGTMYLNNGFRKKDVYPATTAKFENRGFVIDISQGKGATIHGNVMNYGCIKINEKAPAASAARGHRTPELGAMPTPTLIQITGTFGSATCTFQTTINASYYGQLYSAGAVYINGGTLKYVLDPTTYAPPNANTYDIINAGSIGGTPGDFATFTPTPFLFQRQKPVVGGRTMYELYSYN